MKLLLMHNLFQAFNYCEVISKCLTQSPEIYGQALVHCVLNLSSRLKFYDPQRLQMEDMEDPDWLIQMQKTGQAYDVRQRCISRLKEGDVGIDIRSIVLDMMSPQLKELFEEIEEIEGKKHDREQVIYVIVFMSYCNFVDCYGLHLMLFLTMERNIVQL